MGVKRKQAAIGRRARPAARAAILSLTIATIVVWTATVAMGRPPSQAGGAGGIVAIDPGHGGRDPGSRGTGGTLEKEVCLALARELAHIVEPAHRVVLTRSDDYNVALHERSAIANHQKADLFISLHTGASYRHSANDITIYYYQPPGKAPDGRDSSKQPTAWNRIQMAHLRASRELAQALKNNLAALHGQPTPKIIQAPLVVLEGADMPAVAIEVGYLTHPATENALKTSEFQVALARAIAKGIDQFMSASP